MTMTRPKSKKKDEPWVQPIHLLLASGGVLGTLVGGNVLADREWVSSIVPDHQINELLLAPVPTIVTQVEAYTPPNVALPDTSRLPSPIEETNFEISQRVVLAGQIKEENIGLFESGLSNNERQSDLKLPEIPQVAVPVIPERPQVNVQPINLDLPEIPQVQVPQSVSTSKSSK